jgi:dUTP pyrophosphatase
MTQIKFTTEEPELTPKYANPGDAGADLVASESKYIFAGTTSIVSTGVSVAIPDGYVGFITPRSGLAAKYGITVLNTPGTIDSGYRGELKVIMHNSSTSDYAVTKYDRIAQLVILPVEKAVFDLVDSLDDSVRGEGGFGSTGV